MPEISGNSMVNGVAAVISTDLTKKYTGISIFDLIVDVSGRISNHRVTLNIDKRLIACPPYDPELINYEVLATGSPEFLNAAQSSLNAYFIETQNADRSNILISSNASYWHEIQFLGLANLKNTNIQWNLINDQSLYVYENFVRDEYEITRNHPYRVLSYDEIGQDMTNDEKFSLINISIMEVFHNRKLLEKLIGSLRPGGYLCLRNAGDARNLYSSSITHHPFWVMHKKLLAQNGYVYHSPLGIGSTMFVKE